MLSPSSKKPLLSADLLGQIAVILLSLTLTILSIQWMGYHFSLFTTAYIGGIGDPLLNSWTIYQGIYNLTHWPIDLGYSTIFYGDQSTFAYTISPYGISLFVLPIYFLTGQNNEMTYNIYYILTFVLTGWVSFKLIRSLVAASVGASIISALMLVFSQFRMLHVGHIETLSTQFLLLSLFYLHKLLDRPSWRSALGLSIAFWFCLLTSGYLGVIFLMMALIILLFFFLQLQAITLEHIKYFALSGIIAVGGCFPFLLIRLQNEAASVGQSFEQSLAYSAKLDGWVSGASHIYRYAVPFQGEGAVFLGFTPIVLAIIAWRLRAQHKDAAPIADHPQAATARWVLPLYGIISLVGLALSLGPVLQIGEHKVMPLPYILLMQLPVFSWIRVPARFIMMTVIGVSLLSAYGIDALAQRYRQWAPALLAIICITLMIELTPDRGDRTGNIITSMRSKTESPAGQLRATVFDKKLAVYQWLKQQPPGTAVLNYPVQGDMTYTYYVYMPIHQQPMLNGGGSFIPSWFVATQWSQFPTTEIMALLKSRKIRYIIIHHNLLTDTENTEIANRLHQYEQANGPLTHVATFDTADVYEVPTK